MQRKYDSTFFFFLQNIGVSTQFFDESIIMPTPKKQT